MAEKTLKSLTFPGLPDTYNIPQGGSSIPVDSALSASSENPVQNKAIYAALENTIAAPASATSGQFLIYNGTTWTAQTVPNASGVSF